MFGEMERFITFCELAVERSFQVRHVDLEALHEAYADLLDREQMQRYLEAA